MDGREIVGPEIVDVVEDATVEVAGLAEFVDERGLARDAARASRSSRRAWLICSVVTGRRVGDGWWDGSCSGTSMGP